METTPLSSQKNLSSQPQINPSNPLNDLEQPLESMSPQKSKNWLLPLLIIIAILSLCIASYFAYQNYRLKQQALQAQPLNISTATPDFSPSEISPTPTPTTTLTLLPQAVTLDFPCPLVKTQSSPSPDQESAQSCQVIELRVRDLLQVTYNTHHLLREIQNGQIQQEGPLNKVNNLNNGLSDLWLKIASYGLGTDPFVNQHIFFSANGFSEAKNPPTYGISGPYVQMGIPRIYDQFLINSRLSEQEIQDKSTKFLSLLEPYSNITIYPHKDFYERAYNSYRKGELLTTTQYKTDLEKINKWLTSLEKVLEQIPTFLNL